MSRVHRSVVVCFVFLGLMSMGLPAQVSEYFSQSDFAVAAPGLTLVDFDSQPAGDDQLAGTEYIAQGLTIVQTDGGPINVVRNLVPGGWGGNFVTEANINSSPNAISSSIRVSWASPSDPDNFDFVLNPMVPAAGLFVGNLGNCTDFPKTTVQYLDEFDQVIAEEVLGQSHAGVVFGTATDSVCGSLSPVPFDSRIFYGVIAGSEGIRTIRVLNASGDGDGITLDDIQFGTPANTIQVGIDIKPDSDPNCFNINGHGVIPVAILGSAEFDVDEIDIYSLTFDGLDVRVRGNRGPLCSSEDSNGDGFPDLVCHFEDDPAYWTGGDAVGCVTGSLLPAPDGAPIEGCDSICIVP